MTIFNFYVITLRVSAWHASISEMNIKILTDEKQTCLYIAHEREDGSLYALCVKLGICNINLSGLLGLSEYLVAWLF